MAPAQWQISKRDGKSVLLHSTDKKGFHTLKSLDDTIYDANVRAKDACPAKIISVKQV